jgi:autotransporter-associated beta strand protein/YVTN family beta-propeller protein
MLKTEALTDLTSKPEKGRPLSKSRKAGKIGRMRSVNRLGFVLAGVLFLGNGSALFGQVIQKAYIPNGNGSLAVVDTSKNAVVANLTLPEQPGGTVAVTPDGQQVYLAGDSVSFTLYVINAATNTLTQTINLAPFFVDDLATTPNGQDLLVANTSDDYEQGYVSVFSTATQKDLADIGVGANADEVVAAPDGIHAYVTTVETDGNGNDIPEVVIIDIAEKNIVKTITVGYYPAGLAVSPNGDYVYVANDTDNTVSVINTSRQSVVSTIAVGASPGGLAVSPDGLSVYVANQNSNSLSVIDTARNVVVKSIALGSNTIPFAVTFTSDGLYAYVTNSGSRTVSVIDTATQTVVDSIAMASPLGFGIGPNLIIGSLAVKSETTLSRLGFSQFLDFQGGTLQAEAALRDTHSVSLIGTGGTIETNKGGSSTFSGVVSGTGALSKTGPGTLTLTGANTYSGGTNIDAGTVIVDTYSNLGTGPVKLNGGTLKVLNKSK